jgi:predicted enzyme related to lactoylglutathione lyase
MKHAINWFEIPTEDIDRAQLFYETIFNMKMIHADMPDSKMRFFPLDDPMSQTGGAIVKNDGFHIPSSSEGPLIYLNGNPDIQPILDRVEGAGGKILLPKTMISEEYGDMALIQDTEGNRIGIHNVPSKYL